MDVRRTTPLSFALLMWGCDVTGAGSTAPLDPPARPEYERAFDEIVDIPNQITAQIEWAAEPIDDATRLADEIASLRTRLNIDEETFTAMCTVALENGEIDLGAVSMAEDAKAEFEAVLERIREVGQSLQTVPARGKTASKQISKFVMSMPKLTLTATKELGGELAAAVGDGGVQVEADIETVKQLPTTVKAEAASAKEVLAELPEKAATATQNLMAAIAGKPYTPLEPIDQSDASRGDSSDAIASGGSNPSFDPPVPSAPIVDARIDTLRARAAATAEHGDWLSAAIALEEAAAYRPEDAMIAYEAGHAAYMAKDCGRAERHLDHFVALPSASNLVQELRAAKTMLGEITAFACRPRTPEDDAASAKTMVMDAEALARERDFGGAAEQYAAAYQILSQEHDLAYEVGVAAWNIGACSDALRYFIHFAVNADARVARQKIRESDKYIQRAAAGECTPITAADADGRARDLYAQGQALELALDFEAAAGKYERAFVLLPTNYVLAFRAAESHWAAGHCSAALAHYRVFVTSATDTRHAEELERARAVMAHVDAARGCPTP